MSDSTSQGPGDLQFDKAEFADGSVAGPAECARCRQALVGSYYQVNGAPTCERCKTEAELAQGAGSAPGRFLAAAAFGLVAALAGSLLWYAVRATTGYEIGLIAIVVGLMVGSAVRAGSKRRGGIAYQLLAVFLTYAGICAQYVPDLVKGLEEQASKAPTAAATTVADTAPAGAKPATENASDPSARGSLTMALLALALLLVLAMAAPFLGGFENVIGLMIIGFALWEAWKLNRRVPLQIEGPLRVGSAPGPSESR